MLSRELASPKSAAWASRLETQGRVDTAVASPKVIGRQNTFLLGKPQSFLSSLQLVE